MKCPVHTALLLIISCIPVAHSHGLFEDYEPPGDYVLIFEQFRMYFHCEGEGNETVIVEPGIGDSLANWIPIQKELAEHTRVCLYDRAGNGLSDPGPGPRITSQIALELYLLLKQANIEGPYVMVGHSFGGLVAQFFAAAFPDETSGLVLVDSSHWDQVTRLAALDELADAPKHDIGGYLFEDESLLTPEQRLWKHLNAQRKSVWTQMDELKSFSDSADEVNGILSRLPPIPMAVLSRGKSQLPVIPGDKSLEVEWQGMQKDLLNLSPQAWRVMVRDSGHSIHREAPEHVIEQTLKVLHLAALDQEQELEAELD